LLDRVVRQPDMLAGCVTASVTQGWQRLDVGAGGGPVVEWLYHWVSATGRVVATDIDTRFLDALDFPNLEVRKHNVITDALEVATLDLVHVVFHLAEWDIALDRIAAAVRPGVLSDVRF
jgi:hypothetical protein